MVSTTCRAFSGSVLSRWLLSQRRREGGVLRLVRSIAIKDLVTRLGAALRSASSSLYIALARCVKQFICIEANAPGVVALHSTLIFPLFLSRGMWVRWLGNISFNPVFELYAYLSSGCTHKRIYLRSLHPTRRIYTFVLARTSFPRYRILHSNDKLIRYRN